MEGSRAGDPSRRWNPGFFGTTSYSPLRFLTARISSSIEAKRRSPPQREPVEQTEDHEVEGAGEHEDPPVLLEGERGGEEGDRQDDALDEEDAERRRQEEEVRVPRPTEREDGDDRQCEREHGHGGEDHIFDGHHGTDGEA